MAENHWCDGMLIRSEGHLDEFTVLIWKQYDVWLERYYLEIIWRYRTRWTELDGPMPTLSIVPCLMA